MRIASSLTLLFGLFSLSSSKMFNKKFQTVDDVPSEYFNAHKYIYGYVERVIDGDTIRVRHVPGFGLGIRKKPEPLQQRGIAKDTLSIRIYAVDCPEIAKNTRQSNQPFGQEAKEFTESLVYHRMVKITFLRKDQYSRAVAVVETLGGPFPLKLIPFCFKPKDLSIELAKRGLAELYTGGGAEYNGQRDRFEQIMQRAKSKKLGIWSISNRQTAAEKKQEMKRELKAAPASAPPALKPVTYQYNNAQKKTVNAVSTKKTQKKGRSNNVLEAAFTGLEFVA